MNKNRMRSDLFFSHAEEVYSCRMWGEERKGVLLDVDLGVGCGGGVLFGG